MKPLDWVACVAAAALLLASGARPLAGSRLGNVLWRAPRDKRKWAGLIWAILGVFQLATSGWRPGGIAQGSLYLAAALFMYTAAGGLQVRERGLSFGLRTLRWDRLTGFAWSRGREGAGAGHQTEGLLLFTASRRPADTRARRAPELEALLEQYAPGKRRDLPAAG